MIGAELAEIISIYTKSKSLTVELLTDYPSTFEG